MKECNSIEEVCDMAYPRLHELNPRNLSSIWTKISQIIVASNYSSRIGGQQHHQQQQPQQQQHLREQLESIFTKTTDSMMTFEPRDLTQTALSFAKIVREVVAGSSSNHHNGNMMKSNNFRVGGAGVYHEILHDIFIGPNSVNRRRKEGIFQSIADAAIPNIWYFEPRFLSNLAYANAIAGTVPVVVTDDGSTTTMTTTTQPTLFDRIAEVSIPLLAEFNPQDLSNIVWSYEKVRATTSPLFDEVANSILARDDLDIFPPQALSNILLAFAKVHESNNNPKTAGGGGGDAIAGEANTNSQKLVFEKVADHIITTNAQDTTYLDTYTPQALANILWAYATVHECSPALFETVAHHILHHHHHYHRVHNNNNTNNSYLTSFKAQELSNIVWAYASTSNRQPLLFSIVADHILLTTTTILKSFNAQNCGNILWAYATANIIHEELFARVSRHVMHNIDFASLDGTVQYNLLRASEKAQRVVQGKKKKKEGALEEGK